VTVAPAKFVSNLALTAVALLFLAPLVWLITSSFDTDGAFAAQPADRITLTNFGEVLKWDIAGRPLINGLEISGGATAITVIVAILAAYPLSRNQLRFGRSFLYAILFTTGLPVTAVMVPVFGLFVRMKLLDSITGTTLFLAATSLPMAIWMTKNFLDDVPIDLEKAAWVDGATATQTLRRIVLPLVVPGISVVAVLTFTATWGNFFVPFTLLLDPDKQPASVTILSFFREHGAVAYGQLAAYSIVYTTPAVVLYLLVSRTLGSGFISAGAVKA
jgi:multiple sugar transport system permease protein